MTLKIRQWISSLLTHGKKSVKSEHLSLIVASPMPDHAFWYIIERSMRESQSLTFISLWEWLQECELDQVQAFAWCYLEKKKLLASPRTWVVASALNGEMTEARFGAFLNWAISLGKANYELMLFDPDEIAPYISGEFFGKAIFGEHADVATGVWNEKRMGIGSLTPADGFPDANNPMEFMTFQKPDEIAFNAIAHSIPRLFDQVGRSAFDGLDDQISSFDGPRRVLN
jgi:Protein of unknown function (DUF4240)